MTTSKHMRFECTVCGKCCITSGRVYLYLPDLTRIPAQLGLTLPEFVRQYCEFRREKFVFSDAEVIREFLVLRKHSDNRCAFLVGDSCSIHDIKPFQCARAPFIAPVMKKKEVWQAFSSICPGVGKGQEVSYAKVGSRVEYYERHRRLYLDLLEMNGGSLEAALGIPLGNPLEIVVDIGCEQELYRKGEKDLLEEVFLERSDHMQQDIPPGPH